MNTSQSMKGNSLCSQATSTSLTSFSSLSSAGSSMARLMFASSLTTLSKVASSSFPTTLPVNSS